MSVASLGAFASAYSYLQSLLQQQPGNGQPDPTQRLLAAFYPSVTEQPATPDGAAGCSDCSGPINKAWTTGANVASGASAPPGTSTTSDPTGATSSTDTTHTNSTSTASGRVGFSPGTFAALIAAQGENSGEDRSIAARAQHVFTEFDSNADGSISKSEFEAGFGPNADLTKVDGLFNVLDANGDGSVSLDELTSAAEQSRAQHHHHHASGGDGDKGGGGLGALLSASDLTGATTQTTTSPDGSTSTTITFADGSTVTSTTPASSGTGTSGGNAGGTSSGGFTGNPLEQLIEREAQLIAAQASQTLATI
jgi:EF-hand domain pair